MSFTVAGVLDDTMYEVEVTGSKSAPIVGSKRVAALVGQFDGQSVKASPAGPTYTVDGGDPKSVLALLSTQTKVSRIGDGAPAILE